MENLFIYKELWNCMRQTFSKILCSNKNYQKLLHRKYYIIAKTTISKDKIKELRMTVFIILPILL